MQEIAKNVYWLAGRGVNFYLIVEEAGLTLIDAGMPKDDRLVWDAMTQLGYQPADLKRLIVTHADIDHAGGAAAIVAQSGAQVVAGSETAVHLQQGKSPKHMPRLVQFIIDTFISYGAVAADKIDTMTAGDTLPVLGGLQVLATPGHTMDHHALYSPTTGILFAGDALNTRKDTLGSTPPNITADETAATQSAIQLLELAPAVIACGHGTPFTRHDSDQIMALFNKLRASA